MIKEASRIGIKNINEETCNGCGLCVNSCMMDVIYFDEAKKKAYIKYQDDCQACFLCSLDCPVDAITVDAL